MEERQLFKSKKDLCNKFWQFENRLDLLNYELGGVKIWQYLRVPLFSKISQGVGLSDSKLSLIRSISGRTIFEKTIFIFSVFWSCIRYNPFFVKKVDAIVFRHPRMAKINGYKTDIYTHHLIQDLKKQGKSIVVIDDRFCGKYYVHDNIKIKRMDFIKVIAALYARATYKVLRNKINRVHILEEDIQRDFSIKLDLLDLFSYQISKFKVRQWLYLCLLTLSKPEQVYCVVSYGMQGDLISACKKLNIQVIELQHGIVSKYHMGYSYPMSTKGSIDYFPDLFFCWGSNWGNYNYLPLSEDAIVTYGHKYFDKEVSKIGFIQRKANQVIIISQPTVRSAIVDFILNNIKEFQDYYIVYKLHPEEFENWTSCKQLKELGDKPNVTIVKNENLLKLLMQSKILIGVYSTSVYEGLALGCKVFILDLPGYEYMEDLISSGRISLIHSSQKIVLS